MKLKNKAGFVTWMKNNHKTFLMCVGLWYVFSAIIIFGTLISSLYTENWWKYTMIAVALTFFCWQFVKIKIEEKFKIFLQ